MPPFSPDHCPHDFCEASGAAVNSIDSFNDDFRCQTPLHKPQYCSPNHVSAIICLFVRFTTLLSHDELLGRFSAVDPELVLLPDQQQQMRIVA